MSSEELIINIGARDSGGLSTIKQLNNQLKFLNNEYKLTRNSSKTFDNSLQGQKTKLEYLKNSYNVTAQKLEKYKQNMEKAKTTVEQKRQALEQLQQAEGDNAAAIERAQSSLNKAEDSYRRAQQSIVLTEAELRNFQTEIDETNRRIQNNALEQYQRRMQQIGTSVQNAGEKITAFGNGLSSVGNKLTALSAPFIAFSAYAVKTGMEFEEAIAKLGSTSGATASQMEQLKESSINLGEAIKGASATEVAESYNYLAMAGYDVNEMMAAIEPNVKASIAFGSDMATTADLTTDSLSALGLSAQDTGRYLDIVAQASRNANTTGTGLMEAYIGCGGMFRELNTPLEESAALLSTLSNRGIKCSEAGNSMNSILINLMGVAGQSSEAMEALGLSAYDADGKFKGVTNVLRELKTRLSECTDEQKNQFQAMIGGKCFATATKKLVA